jgi:hypothetical protein
MVASFPAEGWTGSVSVGVPDQGSKIMQFVFLSEETGWVGK